jgi:hypothetical protein
VVVKKSDGSLRDCVDLRKMNQYMLTTVEPLRSVEDIICRATTRHTVKTELDLKAAFWQLELDSDDRRRCTAISRTHGVLLCNRLPMGAKDSPNILQRAVKDYIVRPVQEQAKLAGRECVEEVFRDNLFNERFRT